LGCCEEGGRTPAQLEPRGRGSRRTDALPSGRKGTSATGVVPSRGISLGRQACLVIHSCGEQSSRRSIASRARTISSEVGLTIGTARDRGSRTSRWKAPRADGGFSLFAERFSTRGSQTCSIVPAVPVLPDGMLTEQQCSPSSTVRRLAEASERGILSMPAGSLSAKGVNASLPRGQLRGVGATRRCTCKVCRRRDGQVSPIGLDPLSFSERAAGAGDRKIGHRVVRERGAWCVGCLHTGRTSWMTTKGVECRCVQLV